MKNQALFSSKDKCKKLKCRLLQFLFGALRVKADNALVRNSYCKDPDQTARSNCADLTRLGFFIRQYRHRL